jgi:shikimate kinase
MRTAYEVAHKDEIIQSAMSFTANKTAEKVANSVRANASRPSENGLSSNSAALGAVDINKLSREQMEAYKQRALNGERIDLKNLI